jgi:hypothetical protein
MKRSLSGWKQQGNKGGERVGKSAKRDRGR